MVILGKVFCLREWGFVLKMNKYVFGSFSRGEKEKMRCILKYRLFLSLLDLFHCYFISILFSFRE